MAACNNRAQDALADLRPYILVGTRPHGTTRPKSIERPPAHARTRLPACRIARLQLFP